MSTPNRLLASALMLGLAALHPAPARAQSHLGRAPERVTDLAAALLGLIEGSVTDEAGKPLDGAVISALGGTTAFAVSDKLGQFSLRQLPPGPYLVRAHLQGFLSARGSMVNVRPATSTPSTFMLRHEGSASAPQLATAGMAGGATIEAPAAGTDGDDGRAESESAWRLRHLKRSILRDADTMAVIPADDNSFFTDSVQFLGHAVGSSARAATSLFSDLALDGQVNLMTTGAFDNPMQLLQLDRASSVAFFSLGAPVGSHGNWSVRAAMNQTDLNSWMLAANYAVQAAVAHRYRVGMSYSLQRYDEGNAAALAALPQAERSVGSLYGFDEWTVSRAITLGYGASYARYDYLTGSALFSPRVSATITAGPHLRVRASAWRQLSAPGAEEFLPPTTNEYLPPQRTFSPVTPTGFTTERVEHYEVGVERPMNGATFGVRAFHQRIGDQIVTVFGLRQTEAAAAVLGHYFVGSIGDADLTGLGVTMSHAFWPNLRGSIDYSVAAANWDTGARPDGYAVLAAAVPASARAARELIHDVTSTLQAEIPQSATRVVVLYRVSNGFINGDGVGERPGLDGRFDLQVNQALPFMNFSSSQWEMLVAVRSLFHDAQSNASAYDELLVVRPPKRIVGGLTVRF